MSTSLEDYKQKRYKHGYPDFGPTRLPVIPMPLILIDRADGTQWLVSWNSTDFSPPDINGRITINSDLIGLDAYYGQRKPLAQDGVYMNGYILFVRSGRLGFDDEWRNTNSDEKGPPQFARLITQYRQFIADSPKNTLANPVRLAILSLGDPINV